MEVDAVVIAGPQNAPDDFYIDVIRDWFDQIADDRWDTAFSMIDLPPEFGPPFTAASFRNAIQNDHYPEGTVFRKAHPGEIVYSSPTEMGPSQYTNVYRNRGDRTVEVIHPVPIHNEWTDLMATFTFNKMPDGYLLRLDSIYVH